MGMRAFKVPRICTKFATKVGSEMAPQQRQKHALRGRACITTTCSGCDDNMLPCKCSEPNGSKASACKLSSRAFNPIAMEVIALLCRWCRPGCVSHSNSALGPLMLSQIQKVTYSCMLMTQLTKDKTS